RAGHNESVKWSLSPRWSPSRWSPAGWSPSRWLPAGWWPSRRLHAVLLSLGVVAVLCLLSVLIYSSVELGRFERAQTRQGTLGYAAPLALAPGVNVRLVDLATTLGRLKYSETKTAPAAPGQFSRAGGGW